MKNGDNEDGVVCGRCGLIVGRDQLDNPNYCLRPHCPVLCDRVRMRRARMLGWWADVLTAREQRISDALYEKLGNYIDDSLA